MNNFIFPFHMVSKESHIILYGAGTIGTVFFKQVTATKYANIILWVDKNYNTYRGKGYPVVSVEEIADVKNIDYVVIANNKPDAVKEIKSMLQKQYNFNTNQIVCPYDSYIFPSVDLYFPEQDLYETGNLQELYEGFKQKYIKEHNIIKIEPCHLYDINSIFRRRYHINGDRINIIDKKEIATRDLVLAQYYNGDYSRYKFYDAAVRILAIDEYYGKNNTGFNMYRRMQEDTGFDWTGRFKELIMSFEEKGFLDGNVVEVDKHFSITDGAHRTALAIYNNIEFLNILMYDFDRERWDIDVFWEKRFTADECKLIEDVTEKLLLDASYDFIGVLWPPAEKYFDDIINEIGKYSPDETSVVKYFDYEMERGEFWHLFKALYHTDILSEKGMVHKLKLIESCMEVCDGKYKIRVFNLHIKHPMIGLNTKNNTPQSQMVKRIKNVFRNRYKEKLYKYEYDVIMHISDNYLQSKFCSILFQIDYDISEYFGMIKNYDYVVLRAKESRQHKLFPKKFYLRSNSDILVTDDNERDKLAELAQSFLIKHFKNDWISIKKERENNCIYVAAYLRDFLIYKFEFMPHIYGLEDSFIKECKADIIKEDINYLPDKDEVIIRLLEYTHKPHKEWYLTYLKKHIHELDKNRLFNYLDYSVISIEKVEETYNKII